MDLKNQSGQAFIDTLITFIFFAGLFLALQVIIDHHKERANAYKLSQETAYQVHSRFKK